MDNATGAAGAEGNTLTSWEREGGTHADEDRAGSYEILGSDEVFSTLSDAQTWQILSQTFDADQLESLERQYGGANAAVLTITNLKRTWAFNDLSIPAIANLTFAATKVVFKKGENIITQGERAETMFILESGSADVFVASTTDTGKTLHLQVIHAGALVGETCILDENQRTASLVARERTETLRIHRNELAQVRWSYLFAAA
jgi:hypothetical protein